MWVFFLPILSLLFFTVFPTVDLLRGVILGVVITLVQYGLLGIMPLRELFDTCVEGLKSILVEDHKPFVRAVTTKLLAYAMGRHTEPSDRPHIDAILAATSSDGYRFGDLIEQVILSEPFRRK